MEEVCLAFAVVELALEPLLRLGRSPPKACARARDASLDEGGLVAADEEDAAESADPDEPREGQSVPFICGNAVEELVVGGIKGETDADPSIRLPLIPAAAAPGTTLPAVPFCSSS